MDVWLCFTFWYSEVRQAYAGQPFTVEILYAELYIKGLPRYRKLSLNERIKPIIATDGHLNTSKAWSLPHRASVFSYGMKELSWDIREATERRQPPPHLFGKFIYLPLIHCARRTCLPNQWALGRTRMAQRQAKDTQACECLQSRVQLMLTKGTPRQSASVHDGPLTPCEVISASTGSVVIQDFKPKDKSLTWMKLRGWLEFQTGDICKRLGGNLWEQEVWRGSGNPHKQGCEFQSGEPTRQGLDAWWLPITKNENPEGNTPSALKIIPRRDLGTFQPIEGRGLEKDI